MERNVEIPLRLLVDFIDLAESAVEQMQMADVAPALSDALHGSIAALLNAALVPTG